MQPRTRASIASDADNQRLFGSVNGSLALGSVHGGHVNEAYELEPTNGVLGSMRSNGWVTSPKGGNFLGSKGGNF